MIICILGPTASHKSALASLTASLFNADIINFDAFQIYKELNIGTAKPSKDELKDPKYKMYDIVSINEEYSVSRYQHDVRPLIDNCNNHILVGGTGLYLKALLFDYKFDEEDPMPKDYLSSFSNDELYSKLEQIDKEDALKIGRNNRKRLVRALYIYNTHGVNKTTLNENKKDNLLYKNVYFIGINPPRVELYDSINKRVDEMFSLGLEDEIKYLFSTYSKDLRALQAIGYKEFNIASNSEEAKELIKKNTRNYAKRQLTFFKHQFKDVIWFNSYTEAYSYLKEHKDEFR